MKFVCYTDWDQLPASADALFELAEKDSIFFSRPWFENLAAELDDDQAVVLACVAVDNKVMAILPLIKREGNSWLSLKHQYTTHYSLLLGKNDQQRILACLGQGLSQLPLRSLLLEPVACNDSRILGLQPIMEEAGFGCERYFRLYNWIYRVQGRSYEDYMAARPSWLRNTISRKKRKLDRDHGYEVRLFTGHEVPRAMADYYAVYGASWKANEQYTSFFDGMVAALSKRGWTRLAILYVKERPIAAQLWFVLHGKASIFRLAYDEAWRQYSPGSILTSFLMEYVIDNEKVDEIDFLTGNEAYKQDWMSERRERFALSCVRSVKPVGRFEKFVEALKQLLKRA
jgi:hypothetical protein